MIGYSTWPPPMHEREPIPPEVRRAVLARARKQFEGCEDCGLPAPLELHHLTYIAEGYMVCGDIDGGGPIFGQETEDDLAALCRECHHRRHIGLDDVFWPDIDAMNDTFFGFYWAMDKDD